MEKLLNEFVSNQSDSLILFHLYLHPQLDLYIPSTLTTKKENEKERIKWNITKQNVNTWLDVINFADSHSTTFVDLTTFHSPFSVRFRIIQALSTYFVAVSKHHATYLFFGDTHVGALAVLWKPHFNPKTFFFPMSTPFHFLSQVYPIYQQLCIYTFDFLGSEVSLKTKLIHFNSDSLMNQKKEDKDGQDVHVKRFKFVH